jgi:cell wall-associated NlpC family hydrolase
MPQRPAGDRGSATILLAAVTALVLVLMAVLFGVVSAFTGTASACQTQPAPSGAAGSIPANYLADYQSAGREFGIPWTILAGIGTVESGNGQSDAPGVHSGTNPYGAAGPMQFGVGGAAGDTWGGAPVHPASEHTGGYGIDGDHNGIADVYDPGDAIPSAASYLRAHGAPANTQAAIFAYNHSDQYVNQVLDWASRYASGGVAVTTALTSPACQQAGIGPLPAGAAGKVIAYAEAQLGKPYQWGGTGPDAFDCSGLTMMAYRIAGVSIPRTSQEQWVFGRQIPAGEVQPGDLVFFAGSDGTMTSPGHVGIVVGTNEMIDAPYTGMDVSEQLISGVPGLVGYTRP